jgi:hypothetical protein
MITHTSILPSDHVMSAADRVNLLALMRWIRRYASDAMNAGASNGALGSLAAIRVAAEDALAKMDAPVCQHCDGSGVLHTANGRGMNAASRQDGYDDSECPSCEGTGISTEG